MKWLIPAVISCIAISACTTSSTGRQQLTLFSESELGKMGISSFEDLKSKEKISTNPKTNQYVQCVAADIIKQVSPNEKPSDWEVVVFDSQQVNAFALPGKKIGVYTGILAVAETPAQLAAIIGHEVGHVLERHSNERMSQSQFAQIGMQIADAGFSANNVENKELLMSGLGLGVQYGFLMPFSRTHESEADIVGQRLMAKAGYEPKAAIALWQNMAKVSKSAPPEFLSTHPSNKTRITNLTNNLANVNPLYQSSSKGRCNKA